jgi:hypothetical protein
VIEIGACKAKDLGLLRGLGIVVEGDPCMAAQGLAAFLALRFPRAVEPMNLLAGFSREEQPVSLGVADAARGSFACCYYVRTDPFMSRLRLSHLFDAPIKGAATDPENGCGQALVAVDACDHMADVAPLDVLQRRQ